MADDEDVLKYPELAIELLKLEIEWWFQEFEERFFRLLERMADTD